MKAKRILEVGCGIALASLVINHRKGDITATDYHPEVENFLQKNVQLNNGDDIPFARLDWADGGSELGKFDLIIGSDLCYEGDHIEILSNFIDMHSADHCEVIIVEPGRKVFSKLSQKMIKLSYCHSKHKPESTSYLNQPFKGTIHKFVR